MTGERTDYYTGYEDLDNKLVILYDVQGIEEANGMSSTKTCKMQDSLLAEGRARDAAKENAKK